MVLTVSPAVIGDKNPKPEEAAGAAAGAAGSSAVGVAMKLKLEAAASGADVTSLATDPPVSLSSLLGGDAIKLKALDAGAGAS